jgi:hypothetical protein
MGLTRLNTTEPGKRVMILICECCGAPTLGRQWWNRDKGHGVCNNCALKKSKYLTPATMRDYYGEQGIHYLIGRGV